MKETYINMLKSEISKAHLKILELSGKTYINDNDVEQYNLAGLQIIDVKKAIDDALKRTSITPVKSNDFNIDNSIQEMNLRDELLKLKQKIENFKYSVVFEQTDDTHINSKILVYTKKQII